MRTGESLSIIDHFYDKLVHIKLPREVNNSFLVQLYESKHLEMVDFVLKHAQSGYVHYE